MREGIGKREREDMHANNPRAADLDAVRQQNIIRLWNQLRRLQRERQPTAAVVRQIEDALAACERAAA
ncbi:hypothetical protein IC762_18795 [Bradyrhizobium genosp. L]|uniref:hypothetical protein n=1 Tax=Bradyrhizobium genosp. L TaxID=83637 RepID=UPI0018A27485|nr:hypothetical protein [Bradyrhizobium genosp. L]QPF81853.1 hypothetical protein IC762_18795 [Bradyrhizobium genosp. L]